MVIKIEKTRTFSDARRVAPHHPGFTLVEVIVAIAVFAILLLAIVGLSQQIRQVVILSSRKTTAVTIAEEQLETIRNMSYDQVGSDITYPTGPLLSTQTISRNGGKFTVKLNINYVDDPADGVAPADTVPADYKKVEVQVCWDSGSCGHPIRLTTTVVPKTLEYAANAGAMFVTVIDSNGQPVSDATVKVTNATPAVNVVNQTDAAGTLQLLDLPAAANSFHVVVTKSGYSSDQTLAPSAGNPNPTNPDASINVSQVTSVTLAIDHIGSLRVQALDQTTCGGLGSVSVHIVGQRLIGTTPNIAGYDRTFTTDAGGQFLISNLPWDNYSLTIASVGDDVVGVTPPDTIQVTPGSSVLVSVVLAAHQTNSVRVVVRTAGTHGPVAGANVTLSNGGSYTSSLVTDQGILQQSNWVGGAGQDLFSDPTKFSANSGGLRTSDANTTSIDSTTVTNTVSEDFSNTANEDLGNTAADWQTANRKIQLPPDAVLPSQFLTTAQAQSLKLNSATGLIVSVTLTATSQLNGQSIVYAVAADGTTFETVTPGVAHTFVTNGTDLRWRVTLSTDDPATSPSVTGLSLTYTQALRNTTDGTLTSSTFDSGGATNYTTLSWEPTSQPPSAGTSAVRFQVATAQATTSNGGEVADISSNPSTSSLTVKNIGDSTNTLFLAQSFIATATDIINSIDLKIAQHAAPSSTITAFIYSDVGGVPTNNLSGSGQDITVTVPDDSGSTWQNSWLTQPFAPNTALVSGTKYWLVLQVSGSNSSKFWTVVRSNIGSTYTSGTAKVGGVLNNLGDVCSTVAPNSGCDIAFQIRRSGVTETANTPTTFVGPDGTSATYFTSSGSSLPTALNGARYLRYKLFLHTDDSLVTPSISRVSIIKNNACTPPGQVFFSPITSSGTYSIVTSASGYQTSTQTVSVNGNMVQFVDLTPNP